MNSVLFPKLRVFRIPGKLICETHTDLWSCSNVWSAGRKLCLRLRCVRSWLYSRLGGSFSRLQQDRSTELILWDTIWWTDTQTGHSLRYGVTARSTRNCASVGFSFPAVFCRVIIVLIIVAWNKININWNKIKYNYRSFQSNVSVSCQDSISICILVNFM